MKIARVLGAFKTDVVFQYRSGFHMIYSVLSLVYILVINQLPDKWTDYLVPFMIYSDPSVLGFFFIGGLVMLEKDQGTIEMIMVTPLRLREYLLSKVVSLGLISMTAGFAIAFFTGQFFNPLLLALSIGATSCFYTLIGFLTALSSRTVNGYFGKVIPLTLLLILPIFLLVPFRDSFWLLLLPMVGSAKLFLNVFVGAKISETLGIVCIMRFWSWFLFLWSEKSFLRYSQGGD